MVERASFEYATVAEFGVKLQMSLVGHTPIDTKCLVPCRSALMDNIARLCSLCALPMFALDMGQEFGTLTALTIYRLTGFPVVREGHEPTKADLDRKLYQVRSELQKMRVVGIGNEGIVDARLAMLQNATKFIDGGDHARLAGEALYRSTLISAWTAFESAVSDTWETAVNNRFRSLGEKALSVDVPSDESTERAVKAVGKERLSNLVLQHGGNIGDKVGTIVRQERTGAFNKFSGLRAFYVHTFGSEARPLFDTYPDLARLEAIRHVLVHRGGKIDAAFVDRVKSDPDLSDLQIGEHLKVTSAMVLKYVRAAFDCSTAILAFVDVWMATNEV